METDRHTHTQTDTQNDYRNPRCACAPRVKTIIIPLLHSGIIVILAALMKYIAKYGSDSAGVISSVRTSTSYPAVVGHCGNDS